MNLCSGPVASDFRLREREFESCAAVSNLGQCFKIYIVLVHSPLFLCWCTFMHDTERVCN